MKRMLRRYPGSAGTLIALAFSAVAAAQGAEERDASAPNPAEILDRAFHARYDVDLTSRVELVMRNASNAEHRRVFEAAAKMIDGRLHSIGRLSWPHHLRDMTILTIEARARNHDAFVYLPALGRVRRISTAQRGDAFFGTDVTYEDLERRHADEFRNYEVDESHADGEATWLISAQPIEAMTYARVEYAIAKADHAFLRSRYFKKGAAEPYRIVRMPRAALVTQGEHVVPSRIIVENLARGTTTTATFGELVINPPIDDRLFSASALEAGRPAR